LSTPSTAHAIAPCQIQRDQPCPLNSFSRSPLVCSVSADDGCAVGVVRVQLRLWSCFLVLFILVVFVAAIAVVVGWVHCTIAPTEVTVKWPWTEQSLGGCGVFAGPRGSDPATRYRLNLTSSQQHSTIIILIPHAQMYFLHRPLTTLSE